MTVPQDKIEIALICYKDLQQQYKEFKSRFGVTDPATKAIEGRLVGLKFMFDLLEIDES